jgi:hypothetical protein
MVSASQPTGSEVATDLVIVVPGSDVKRHGEALERLIDGLQRYVERRTDVISSYRIASRQGEGVGQATVELQRADGTAQHLDIRELSWAELRPSMRDVAIYTRAWRGGRLVAYWARALLFTAVPPTSLALRRWLLFGTVALVLWYAVLLAAGYHSIRLSLHEIAGHIWPPASDTPKSADWHAGTTAILWAVVIAALGVKWVTDGIDLSWSSYAFMVDRDSLRRKLRLRLRGMLTHVATCGEHYRRIILVAHSFGTAVAADALGTDQADGAVIPRLELVTLGSPIEFLACRDRGMQTLVDRCVNTDAISAWADFYAEEDAFCTKVPLPDGAQGKFRSRRVWLGYSPTKAALGRAHNAYFQHPEVLDYIMNLPPAG